MDTRYKICRPDGWLAWLLLAAIVSTAGAQPAEEHHENAEFILRRQRTFHKARAIPEGGEAARAWNQAIHYTRWLRTLAPELQRQEWRSIGPRPTIVLSDATSAGPPIASGRVTAIAVHPSNANVAYLGAANGGVWKTVDAGGAWIPLTDFEETLAIGSLAIDPSNPNIVYAGTGEANFSTDSYFGLGILKTIDGGRSWKLIARNAFGVPTSPMSGGSHIGAIAIHPRSGRILLAAAQGATSEANGIYRSTDAGHTWKLVLKGAPGTSVLFNPKDPSIAYAGLGGRDPDPANGVYKSADGGRTWSRSGQGIPAEGLGRVSLAIAASNPQVLYAAVANATDEATPGVFKSLDAGATWSKTNAPGYCVPTCWYANSIQVSPTNPDLVIVGGLKLNITRDGGNTWISVSEGSNGNYIHWDIHSLVFGAGGRRVYIGTDGGVYRGEDIGVIPIRDIGWTNINDTLAITQFYPGCSSHPEFSDFMICGTQDNGTQMYTGGNTWRMIAGGDGGFTAIDFARPSVFYYSSAGMVDLNKSSPFTLYRGFLDIKSGLEDVNTDDCFLPPLTLDPANSQRLYFGCREIFRSDDGGGLWSQISRQERGSDEEEPEVFTYIAVSPVRSDRVYAASNAGKVYVSDNGTADAGVVWTERSEGLPKRPISAVIPDYADPSTAYVTVLGFFRRGNRRGHIFKTTDAGVTWKDISANLPNIPANTLTLSPGNPSVALVGTDTGVFLTRNGGVSWFPLGKGLPNSPVVDIKLYPSKGLLRAATHGRGMWELRLPAGLLSPRALMVHTARASLQATLLAPVAGATVMGSGFTEGAVVRWNGTVRETKFVDSSTLEAAISLTELASPGRATLSVVHPRHGISNFVSVDTGNTPVVEKIYNGALSAAGPQPASLAPGTIANLEGANLAAATSRALGGNPAQTLAGAVVELRSSITKVSYVATLLSASPRSITFQVPWDVPVDAPVQLDVVAGTHMSKPVPVNIARFSPGVFAVDSASSQGRVICVNDGKLAAPVSANSRPAQHGESVTILATGLGGYFESGSGPPDTIVIPIVRIGEMQAVVTSSRAKPPFTGFYEVTVTVPGSGTEGPSGPAVPLTLAAGGVESNTVTIAIE